MCRRARASYYSAGSVAVGVRRGSHAAGSDVIKLARCYVGGRWRSLVCMAGAPINTVEHQSSEGESASNNYQPK